jgi:hypothetical protein
VSPDSSSKCQSKYESEPGWFTLIAGASSRDYVAGTPEVSLSDIYYCEDPRGGCCPGLTRFITGFVPLIRSVALGPAATVKDGAERAVT